MGSHPLVNNDFVLVQLESVKRLLNQIQPEQIEVEIFRIEESEENGIEESELDEMGS